MTSLQKRQSLALAVATALTLVLLYVGCGPADEPEPAPGANGQVSGFGEYGVAYTGETSMEELALRSEVIARVRFNAAQQTIERLQYTLPDGITSDVYAAALIVTFDVLEYLKGNGGSQVRAVLVDGDWQEYTEAEVRARDEDLLAFRDKQWDDREAIVFLTKAPLVPRTLQVSDLYHMAFLRANGEHAYTVSSKWEKAWLPDAAPPSSNGRAAGASGDAQRFLTNVLGGGSGASRRSNGQLESMTLGELKTFIANLEAQVTAGGGSEEYRKCLIDKYYWKRSFEDWRARVAADGREYPEQFARELASGSPAGSEVYEGGNMLTLTDTSKANEPTWSDVAVIKSGQDASLFNHTWPLIATTTRPLPAREYRFFWAEQNRFLALCDALSDDHKTRDEVVLTVTAPENTLHEAFFDPVTLASGVGADSSNGLLNPASFSVDGTSTSITGLKWESGSVVLSLSPYSSLSGHKLDFIELDGSVGLSLEVSSATEDTVAGTFTWPAATQPWHDGDMLMLRIATLTVTPDPTPVPTAEPTPIPTAGITVTLSPRPAGSRNLTNLSIQWNDPAACDSRYLVGIYNSSGTTIHRFYGYHPAPDTTSLERKMGLPWDSIADFDWLVRVSCSPSGGDQTIVGEAELRSGLP